MDCRRCGGRGQIYIDWERERHGQLSPCFVCHGKGTVKPPSEQLSEYFLKLKRKFEKEVKES